MDDWDLISSGTPPDSTDDPSGAVSAPQPRRRRGGQSIEISVPRRVALLGLVVLLIVALVGGIAFIVRYVSDTHGANSIATITVGLQATATALQQIYTQATSGTPVVDDPLSDNRNNWKLFTNDSGEECAFAGGAYHLIVSKPVSKPGKAVWCESAVISNFDKFTLQVEMTVFQGNDGSIVFGENTNGAYSIDIHPNGIYALYRIHWNQPPISLRYGSSSAIKQGLNQANVITINVNDNNFYFYANKQFLTSDYLTDYGSGAIHFSAVGNDQAATDIAYSNLKIWTL